MRTLFLSPVVPYPLNSGTNQRIFHLLRAVAAVSAVTFVFPRVSNDEAAESAPIRDLVDEVYSFSFDSYALNRDRRLPRLVQSLKVKLRYCHPTEPALLQWLTSAQGRDLVSALRPETFDLVWGEKLRTVRLLAGPVATRVIIDLDDLEHRKLGSRLRHAGLSPWMGLDALEYCRLRAVERGIVRRPYELLVCSDLDRRVLGARPNVHVVPNGVDLAETDAATVSGRQRPHFVFVGEMAYPPNVDAVRVFASRIYPRLRRRVPGARLTIVGRNPDPAVQRLHDGVDIVVTGTVPSVEPYLRAATALVVPLRSGGGTRIKILEALGHRVPVISTRIGAEGLDVEDGRHVLLADSDVAFAEACARVWNDAALAERLGSAGQALVREKYAWPSIESRVKDLVTCAVPGTTPDHAGAPKEYADAD